ncbi:YscO family type III secretion system apparatus protein [Pseudovibrio sp. Tun.PSC04-5.I4]|uniref:type III secretion system stalk subunit SctO n=1 Tax=Pseudovibrio sp. Tun.PSC04-5.I4 TaxID=1798213 RepID=UPI00088CD515|nr:YscO family type III secretion system apparatus protein [Pseudovibrio sp. Tun.PSC04-5.I4]SDR14708.1 Type III secretion protein YscO [Pseudovibrio sp. Tun.PSC04-5.I4]
MINQIKKLHLVKTLKEQKAQKALNAELLKVNRAKQQMEQKRQKAVEEREALLAKQDALYEAIIKKVISTDDLDKVKEQAQVLENAVKKLEDAAERATYVYDKALKNAEVARQEYQKALRVKDKYGKVAEDLLLETQALAEAAEEQEIEEQFSGRRQVEL